MDEQEYLRMVGQNLKRLRASHCLTLEEVHKGVGASFSYLSRIENGKAQAGLYQIYKLARFYKTSFDVILGTEQGNKLYQQLIHEAANLREHVSAMWEYGAAFAGL